MPCRHGALSSGMPKATALTRRRMPLSSVTHSSGFAGVTLGTRGAALCLFSWGSSAVDLRCRSSFRSSAPVGIREVLRVEVAQAAVHRLRGDRVEQRRRSVTGRGGGKPYLVASRCVGAAQGVIFTWGVALDYDPAGVGVSAARNKTTDAKKSQHAMYAPGTHTEVNTMKTRKSPTGSCGSHLVRVPRFHLCVLR